jgi:hypothetical protein
MELGLTRLVCLFRTSATFCLWGDQPRYIPTFAWLFTYQISLAFVMCFSAQLPAIPMGAMFDIGVHFCLCARLHWHLLICTVHSWGVVDLLACHADCIWPEVIIDADFPPTVCMDQHRSAQILHFLDPPFCNPILWWEFTPANVNPCLAALQQSTHLWVQNLIVCMVSFDSYAMASGIHLKCSLSFKCFFCCCPFCRCT